MIINIIQHQKNHPGRYLPLDTKDGYIMHSIYRERYTFHTHQFVNVENSYT